MLKPKEKKGFDFSSGEKKPMNKSWSKMLARVLKIDVLACACGGQLAPLGAVQDPDQIRRYLKHSNMDYEPPPRGPPPCQQGSFGFGLHYDSDETGAAAYPG